jgi:hypothetical protein
MTRTLSSFLLISFIGISLGAWSQKEAAIRWSGTITYAAEANNVPPEGLDYLPTNVVLETDGKNFRIVETGTDFERIWLINDDEAHVLFHFLGHAVELLEICPSSRPVSVESRGGMKEIAGMKGALCRRATGWAVEAETLGAAPCLWPTAWIPLQCTIEDGAAHYTLTAQTIAAVNRKDWPRKHFDIPPGYEPVDRITLSTLISSIH